MNTAELLREKVRQRRLAFQKTISSEDANDTVTSDNSPAHATSSWVESTQPHGEKVHTTAEVVTEIPDNVKTELRKKRSKLKQLKKTSVLYQDERNFQFDGIERDVEESLSAVGITKSPSIQNKSQENDGWFSTFDDSLDSDEGPLHAVPFKSPQAVFSEDIKKDFQMVEAKKNKYLSSSIAEIPMKEIHTSVLETSDKIQHTLSKSPSSKKNNIHGVGDGNSITEAKEIEDYAVSPEAQKMHFGVISTKDVTGDEAHDFFTRIWEDDGEQESVNSSVAVMHVTEDATGSGFEEIVQMEEDSTELLEREYFERELELNATRYVKPTYIPSKDREKKAKEILFYPSSKPVPVEMKIPEGKAVRNFKEEGFYVIKKPTVASTSLNRLENRLLKEKKMQWFDEDGSLKILPNPVLQFPIRKLPSEAFDPYSEMSYVKAYADSSSQWKPGERYQLDLDISSLSFTHHPLFSEEHILMSRLVQMCQMYNSNIQKDIVMSIKQRLKALRVAVENLKGSTSHDEHDDTVILERLNRLKTYQEDIKQTRKMRDFHEADQSTLLNSIINYWNDLKNLRGTQGYTNTPIKITLIEEYTDEEEEAKEWEQELLQELDEEQDEYEIQYEKLLQLYYSDLEKWKQVNKLRKQAMKRQQKREKFRRNSSGDTESPSSEKLDSTALEDERVLSEDEIPKPQPPETFDRELTMQRLIQNAQKMRRKPGEPKVTIKVDYDVSITSTNQVPKAEQQRRNEVAKCKLHFRIVCNDKKVYETSHRSLNQDFSVTFGQIFKLQIFQLPESFQLEVYDSAEYSRLFELYLPIPDPSLNSNITGLVEYQFSSDQIMTFKHAGVGSGVPFKFRNDEPSWLLTSGFVRCCLAWGVADSGTVLAPKGLENGSLFPGVKKWSDPLPRLMVGGITNISKLKEWVQKSHLDPNDPSNSAVLQLINDLELNKEPSTSGESTGFYRLEPMQEAFDFVAKEELESNKRFHLLQLRHQGAPDFRNLQMIPADEKDIPMDILEQLHKKSEIEDKVVAKGGIEAQRDDAQKLMHKMKEVVAKRFHAAQHRHTLEDIVVEEKIPNIGTLGFSLLKLFQIKRPLHPVRKERKKVTGQTVASTEVKIMVTIMHAMNVPVRIDVDPVKERLKKKSSVAIDVGSTYESQVHPFVEVMFQRIAAKTNVGEGPHPTWNQELNLPFRAPNDDYNPVSLENIKDSIYFNIFDEVTVDLLEDEKDRESLVYERLERRWLGNMKIPFSTLYLNSKIEGTFRVNVPPVLLGYENEPRPWLVGGNSGGSDNHTYLSLFITIEPCLQLPEIFRERCDSGEPGKVLQEWEKWRHSIIPRFPRRAIKVMTVDIAGKWIFVSRFLRPIQPPSQLLEGGKDSLETLELLARFVSLIPTVPDSIVYPGLCDLWCTCDQFLQTLIGDEEEHAILLCCFFLHLGIRAMLLLGAGIPEGSTAYVLTWQSTGDLWVWNAATGDHFNVRDNHSPLQRVGCLVSCDNAWANIQKNDHPARINFDVNKASEWKPFFNRSFSNPGLRSIQPEVLLYTTTDANYVERLQETIKKNLQESIMKWRRRLCTSWNSYCNQVLYEILTRLERNAGRTASIDSLQGLEQILSSHKMSGFPLSMPYTDIDAIIEAVFATGVHLTEDKNAEFALAVYIHPYPCSVLAIWVYVAVLISRR